MFGFLRKMFSPIGRKMASLFRIGRKTPVVSVERVLERGGAGRAAAAEFVDLGGAPGIRSRIPQSEISLGQGFYQTPGLALKNFKYPV